MRAFAFLLLALPGCSKESGGSSGSGGPASWLPEEAARLGFDEKSEYWNILKDERQAILDHFQRYNLATISFHKTVLEDGSTALLFFFDGAGPRPVLVVLDRAEKIAWKNDDPLKGVEGYTYGPTLAPGPDGGLLLAWKGTSPRGVFARRFDRKGNLAGHHAVSDADPWHLSVLYWPGVGWVFAHSTFHEARAQLLVADGRMLWGAKGVLLSGKKGAHNPISVILDSPEGVTFLWYDYGDFEPMAQKNRFLAAR